ncbi:zinc ribbon domain-containing protein [Lactiplantibacillus songbeiensis]|uniref:Zinc ribbon domain-containing protein n=1 Tax=Lactiplantibacillus songbeiensis TaxID=2559920 RepID=A0ABW4C415_9LACO|nr:zinc ribbon domain-containing protein [Lactiplantibacillus songbeiensis]
MHFQQKLYRAADDQGGERRFCPNCGQAVTASDEFCGNCGYNLLQAAASQETTATSTSSSQSQSTATTTQSTATQPTEATRTANVNKQPTLPKWAWITIIVIVVLIGGAYLFGRNYYSRANQLDRDISALKTGKKGLAQQFTTSDPSLKLTDKTLQPLVNRFKSNRQSLATFQSQLRTGSMTTDGLFEYTVTGKKWLLFDKYQIKVKPLYAKLTTNRSGVQLKINGKSVGSSNSNYYEHKFGPYVPGNYQLLASGTVNGQLLQNKSTVYLHQNNQRYDLSLKTISFTVTGTPKTTVYLNGKSQGQIGSDGTLAIKETAWSSNLELTGKYKVGGSTVTSKTRKISQSDADGSVSLTFPGVMSKSTASDYLTGLFTAISNYTDSGDLGDASDDDDKNLDSYFVDGTANSDYQGFMTMAKGYYKNDGVLSVDYSPSVLSVAPATKQQSQLTYDVKYDFENSKDERIQVFRYTATLEPSGDSYKIVKITPAQKIRAYTSTD